MEEGSPNRVRLSKGASSGSATPLLGLPTILPARIPRILEKVVVVMPEKYLTYA